MNSRLTTRSVNKRTPEYEYSKWKYNELIKSGELQPTPEEHKGTKTQRRERNAHYFGSGGRRVIDGVLVRTSMAKFGRYMTMTDTQKKLFLQKAEMTLGDGFICVDMKITLNLLERTKKEDPDFRDKLATIRAYHEDMVKSVIHEHAIKGGEPMGSISSAIAINGIWARDKTFKTTRAQKARELRIKEAEVKAKVSFLDKSVDLPNMKQLSNDEVFRYSELHARVVTGDSLTSEEQAEYIALVGKSSPHRSVGSNSNGLAKLNGIDAHFDNGEESEDDD